MTLHAFVRRYLLPFAGWYAAGVFALLATNAIAVTIPIYVAAGVDALSAGAAGRPVVLRSAALVALMGVVVIGVRTLSRLLFFTPGRYVERALKADLFEALLRHQPAFVRRFETGDLFSRMSSDVNQLRLLSGFGILQVANTVFALGLAGAQMVRLGGSLAPWLLVPLALGLVVVQISIRRLFELMRQLQRQQAALSGQLLATLRGVATVHAAGATEAFLERFEAHNEAVLQTTLTQARVRAALGPVLSFAADVNIVLLLALGAPRVLRADMTVGELVALTTLIGFVTGPLRASSFLWSIVRNGQAALERVGEILVTPAHRPDLPDPVEPGRAPPRLEVRGLTFRHPNATHHALEDVSFTVPAGSTLGLFGATGSGKSTLLGLLARLHDPPPGTILIDGIDVRRLDLDAWRRRATLVPQRPFLFSESLADNVLLGGADRSGLADVLALADLSRDVAALPEGADTVVGEAGVRLSGGQRQRTALARALHRGGVVLLLDDVLSAVDHQTEQRLLDVLKRAGEHAATRLVVAHRVSALLHADQVVVLDAGRIVDQGAPSALLARPGAFRDAWLAQQQHPDAEGA